MTPPLDSSQVPPQRRRATTKRTAGVPPGAVEAGTTSASPCSLLESPQAAPKRRRTTAKHATTRPSLDVTEPAAALATDSPSVTSDSLESTPKRRRTPTKHARTENPSVIAEPTVALGTELVGDAPETALVIPEGHLEIDPTLTNLVGGDHGISPDDEEVARILDEAREERAGR